jgi:predicted negative regulator of RcsB-dependent stress response
MQEIVVAWFKENYKTLTATSLIVLAVVGGTFLYRWNQSVKRQKAAEMLRQGVNLFYAVRKSDQPDFSKASSPLQSVIRSYPGTSAASQAELYLGHIYFLQGDYDSSEEHYRRAVDGLRPESPFMELALLDVAYAKEAKGDYEGAIGL